MFTGNRVDQRVEPWRRNVARRARWLTLIFAFALLVACSATPVANEMSAHSAHGDVHGLPPATTGSFFLLLTAGLFTGFSHCVGMCGPLVTTFAMRRQTAQRNAPLQSDTFTPLVFYQVGRLATYMGLGAILGLFGSLVGAAASGDAWQGNLSIVIGVLMVLSGLSLWGVLPWLRWVESAQFTRQIGCWMRRFLVSNHPAAPFVLGIANGLLPCGAVYAMALAAAASGNPLQGAMVMFAFGLGTLPAMLGVSFLAMRLGLRLRSNLYRVAALLVIVVGVQLALRGLAATGVIPHVSTGGVALW
jgi:hypothetical protein